MTDTRPHLEPGPDHPITLDRCNQHVTARIGDAVVAETDRALVLQEASYPPVLYLPRQDVADGVLEPSETRSYCPYKGDAAYFDLVVPGGARLPSAVWSYPTPYPAVARIAGYVAFYPDRVDVTAS
jgi:uncharacterized protein (DUF427 family)